MAGLACSSPQHQASRASVIFTKTGFHRRIASEGKLLRDML